jgi:hypothetical protein
MAAHIDYDTDLRVIYVTTAPTGGVLTLDVQVDIFSDMKEDWKTDANLNKLKFPLSEPVGGNVIVPGSKNISPYYFLKYNWLMRPYDEDHTLYLENGYLLVDGGGDPWLKSLGGYTVNVRDSIPADAYAIGGAATPENIADAVWDEILTGATHNIPASAGRRLRQLGDVISGTVVADSGNSTIQFTTDLTESRDDFYNDQLVRFVTGNLLGYAAPILDYDGTNKIITVDEPMVDIPDDGIEFGILPTHVHPISQIVDGMWEAVASGYLTAGTFGEMVNNLMWITGNKVTKSGDIITIYENDEITPWRQYDLAAGGRVEV